MIKSSQSSLKYQKKNINKKIFYIKTYGCQMNVYDTHRIIDLLSLKGYKINKNIDHADIIILNTCHIREKATEKIYSEIGRIRKIIYKKNNLLKNNYKTRPIIVITGCVAQAEGKEIIRRAPLVDIVCGPQSYHKLPEMLDNLIINQKKIINIDFLTKNKFDTLSIIKKSFSICSGVSAFLTIQEGCDKFCSFCVVPYTRGVEYSRPVTQILNEAKKLINDGIREIVLLGQNVNSYYGEDSKGKLVTLSGLVAFLDNIKGLDRIRYMTSHPNDMSQELINMHKNQKSMMPYLHLPVQSGSNKILKFMNRKYTRESYLKIINKIKQACPSIAISGDFIVGFPGETEDDFDETISLVHEVNYSQSYSFKYSSRPGTPAAILPNQVDNIVSTKRLIQLQKILNKQRIEFNKNIIGCTLDVLFDKIGYKDNEIIGRTPYLQSVVVKAPKKFIGQIVPVYIENLENFILFGKLID